MNDFTLEQHNEMNKHINWAIQEWIEKHANKTWIVIEWEYYFKNKDLKKGFAETSRGKTAKKLYCIETGETKEI